MEFHQNDDAPVSSAVIAVIEKFKDELSRKENALKICEEDKREILQNAKCQLEEAKKEFKDELARKENALNICEEDKREIIELLQKVECQFAETKKKALRLQREVTEVRDNVVRRNSEKELKEALNHLEQSRIEEGDAKKKALRLQSEVTEVRDNVVKRNSEKELKEALNHLEQSTIEEGDVRETERFKMCLRVEILKIDLKLRDLQQEYLRKLKDIEMKYQKAWVTTNDLYKEQVDEMENLVCVNEERYKQLIKEIQLDAEKTFRNERQGR